MDPWKELSAWQTGRDELRKWAALEGKSLTTRDDLFNRQSDLTAEATPLRTHFVQRCVKPTNALRAFNSCAHLGWWLLELWRYFRSG
jgi:hypothetical protein